MGGGQNATAYVNLYSSKAHVFQINPETKNSWLPKGDQAIPITFVSSIINEETPDESSKRELKIVGTAANGDAVLDALILAKTTFTKRSEKFGQWIDHTGTLYGLGFNSESELNEFVETFQKLQRNILSPVSSSYLNQHPHHVGSVGSQSQMLSQGDRHNWNQQQLNNVSEINGRQFQTLKSGQVANSTQQYSNVLTHPGHQLLYKRQDQEQQGQSKGKTSLNNGNESSTKNNDINLTGCTRSQSMVGLQPNTNGNNNATTDNNNISCSPISQSDWLIVEQLRYENERLKQALEENSKNAAAWSDELVNLRTNNVKLTQALQESKAHVEEWERELYGLRDENKDLKLRLIALESATDSENSDEYIKDLQKYKSYVEEVESELRRKEIEIEELQKSMQDLALKNRPQNGQLDEPVSSAMSLQHKQKLETMNAKFESKVRSLADVQKELKLFVNSLGL